MIIKVTKEHIQKGKRGLTTSCPVAYALKEVGFTKVTVGWNYLNYDNLYTRVYTKTPRRVVAFINKFDQGKEVKSFKFELGEKL